MYLNTTQRKHSMAGYTLDQTILIVAVIAILVTIIVGSMGWELLGRAGGTKLASHLRQIETANGQFYSEHAMWPQDATGSDGEEGSPDNNMLVLLGDTGSLGSDGTDLELKNYIPSYEIDSGTVRHPFGNGGTVTQALGTLPASGTVEPGTPADGDQSYLVIQYSNVPIAEATDADKSIDGKAAGDDFATSGRVRFDASGSSTTVYYYANVVN